MKHFKNMKLLIWHKKKSKLKIKKLVKPVTYDLLNLCASYGKGGVEFMIVFYSSEIG